VEVDMSDNCASSDDPHAGQILVGARKIADYLIFLGFSDMSEKRVFDWCESGRLPHTRIGTRLIANKRALLRHFGLEE
jgi:hypothetical protein